MPVVRVVYCFIYISMYTNLVVIVNAYKIVDKSFTCFVNRGLRR
jgi:hypothetical protein